LGGTGNKAIVAVKLITEVARRTVAGLSLGGYQAGQENNNASKNAYH
jgi:hypothetical protein